MFEALPNKQRLGNGEWFSVRDLPSIRSNQRMAVPSQDVIIVVTSHLIKRQGGAEHLLHIINHLCHWPFQILKVSSMLHIQVPM